MERQPDLGLLLSPDILTPLLGLSLLALLPLAYRRLKSRNLLPNGGEAAEEEPPCGKRRREKS